MRSLWRLNAPNIACDPCLYQFSASHFRRVFTYAVILHTYNLRQRYAYVCRVPRFPMQIYVTCRTSRPREDYVAKNIAASKESIMCVSCSIRHNIFLFYLINEIYKILLPFSRAFVYFYFISLYIFIIDT